MLTTPTTARTISKKKGFTLTEIAIVLGIIGLILGAVWTAASGVYANTNSTKVANQLGIYIASLRAACGNGQCTASTAVPSVSASLPSVPGVVVSAPTIDSTGGYVLFDFTTIPTTSGGTSFCQGISNAITTNLGGVIASTSTVANTVPTTNVPTCSSWTSGSTPPTCAAFAGFNSAYVGGSSICTSTTTTVSSGSCAYSPKINPCGSGTTVGARISVNF